MAAQGWLGLHLPEEVGGQGFTLAETAVILEEMGHALFPGPVLPTVLVSAALARQPTPTRSGRCCRSGRRHPDRRRGARRRAAPAERQRRQPRPARLRAARARSAGRPAGPRAARVEQPMSLSARPDRSARRHARRSPASTTPRRRHPRVPTEAVPSHPAEADRGASGGGARTGPVLVAAESTGIARWCVETASDYAKVRVQFGRPSASSRPSSTRWPTCWWPPSSAPRWPGTPPPPGARTRPNIPTRPAASSSAAIAGAVALEAAAHCAKKCVQVLGGIGFTWEHDAHFYLKRAMANLQLVTGGDIGQLDHEVAPLAVAGARRNLTADLPEEAEAFRHEIRQVVARLPAAADQRAAIAEAGLIIAALARALGPGRLTARATRHRRGARAGRRARVRIWPSAPGPSPPSSRTGPTSNRSAGCAPPCWGS